MAAEVAKTLRNGGLTLVQAGTGTGKSLGYLIPAFASLREGIDRVVVSTATLALQRQILTKDAPIAAEAVAAHTDVVPRVALLKGWHHYLCLHKLHGGYPDEGDTLFSDAPASQLGEEVLRVREWAKQTETGDRDDLSPGVRDQVWRQVSVQRQECLAQRCPLLEECFASLARTKANEADVVVTNHTLLGIHAAGDTPVLPDFDALIVDEAHDLESRVRSAGALRFSGAIGRTIAGRASREVSGGTLEEAVHALADALEVTPSGRVVRTSAQLSDAAVLLQAACREASEALRARDGDDGGKAQARAAVHDLTTLAHRILGEDLATGADVCWIERGRDESEAPVLQVAPLDVATQIAHGLLQDRAAVLTSATLNLGGSFEAAAASVGAPLVGSWRGIDVGSPFDYAKQGILYVAADVPAPGREGVSDEAFDVFAELVHAAGGRTLALFSSRRGVERAAERLRVSVDTPVLVQGEGQLNELVETFLAQEEASLLGTLSLWQGVDAPGDTCRLVVIDRIPFPRPDDPLIQARNDAVRSRGGNPFMAVSATHAALLLAQGSGRLIRRSSDRGVVAVLDPRLATARYGGFLRASMPGMWPTTTREHALAALRRLGAETEARDH
ncbi:MAG: ATP-dependent DNA helicase [Bowdeniella nasicola]|nr:ATP-dependent DNA helicase [Bowdeniella nasicola]